MPRRTVLSASQRLSFETLPVHHSELARHYTLSDEDLMMIRQRRQSRNRIGFAVQLCLLRYPGRRLRSGETLPHEMLTFIAEQIGEPPTLLAEYATREETRREHFLLLAEAFKFHTFSQNHYRAMIRWLIPIAVEHPKSLFLVGAVLNELRHRQIVHPPLLMVERLVATAELRADWRVLKQITSRLTKDHRITLDAWLTVQPGQSQSQFSWVRQPIGRPCPANVLVILERLSAIDSLNLPKNVPENIPSLRKESLAREGRRVAIHNLRMFQDARRFTVMAVSLAEIKRSLIDEALTMHDRIVSGLIRRSKRKHLTQLQDETKRLKNAIGMFAALGQALMKAKETGQDVWEAIDQAVAWDDLCKIAKDAETLSGPRTLNHLHFIDAQYPQIRRYAPALLEHFNFQAASGGQDVLNAIQLLRDMNHTGKRKVPSDAPTSFVNRQWAPFVHQEDRLDRRYYELCALSELRNRLRAGDIWVPGSRHFQDFEGYLLGQSAFAELRKQHAIPVAVETDCQAYVIARSTLLQSRLDAVHHLLKSGQLEDVTVKDRGFSMKSYRGTSVPDEIRTFGQEIYAALPRIKITDLLVEVDQWTGFTEQFTHLRTGLPSDNKQGLLTVILSDGINLGLTRMAEACQGCSFKQLSWTADWYVRDECYARALAELVNAHYRLDLVNQWGDGTTSSSDGQQFPLGSVAQPLGDVNPKYGSYPGVMFYTHISDQYSPFHTQLIHTNTRDATYVLDGLLYHESDLNIEEHYTDTAGFTDHVFGLCHLLGFRFAPRMRDIGDLSLFPVDRVEQWPQLAPVFGDRIKIREIETQWDDLLRLASSIRLGTVTASLIIRKLASYPRQNRLALALRELGRIERTLFILEWMEDPALRGRVQAGLNKGEARNALARAVFFNRLGEVRDRSFENQCYRASGLNLVVAAIILWNTVQLEKAIAKVRHRRNVPDEYLSYLSPLGWEHINLTGDYVWNLSP